MIESSNAQLQDRTTRLYERLLHLYPPRFRRQFSSEILAVYIQLVNPADSGERERAFWLREIIGLLISILHERWHERHRKEGKMDTKGQVTQTDGGHFVLQTVGEAGRGFLWVVTWALLMTAAYPLALMTSSLFAFPFLWILNWGTSAALWHAAVSSLPQQLGMLAGLAVELAVAQWIMLRRRLPHPGAWFAATFTAIWLFLMALFLVYPEGDGAFWIISGSLLALGLLLGLAQWLVLRRCAPNAHWIIAIDILAAFSFMLLFIKDVTVIYYLLIPLMAPGIITGLGIWLLLRGVKPAKTDRAITKAHGPQRMIRSTLILGLGVAAVFFFLWVYAASNLAFAKTRGVYPTAEELVVAWAYQQPALHGYKGVNVIRVENVKAGPNAIDGSQPQIGFGGGTVYYDRAPEGRDRAWDAIGINMVHVRDGWVQMDDILFPWFLGRVMELYNLEGVRQFQRSGDS